MKKQIVVSGIAILFIVVGLSGCFDNDNSNSELNKFVGTWKHGTIPNGPTIRFSSSGECFYIRDNAEWEIKNGKLVVDFTDVEGDVTLTFDYEFLDDNQVLILTDVETGQIDDYKKQ